jgi:hypothetical protein
LATARFLLQRKTDYSTGPPLSSGALETRSAIRTITRLGELERP